MLVTVHSSFALALAGCKPLARSAIDTQKQHNVGPCSVALGSWDPGILRSCDPASASRAEFMFLQQFAAVLGGKDYNSPAEELRHADGCSHVMLGFTLQLQVQLGPLLELENSRNVHLVGMFLLQLRCFLVLHACLMQYSHHY